MLFAHVPCRAALPPKSASVFGAVRCHQSGCFQGEVFIIPGPGAYCDCFSSSNAHCRRLAVSDPTATDQPGVPTWGLCCGDTLLKPYLDCGLFDSTMTMVNPGPSVSTVMRFRDCGKTKPGLGLCSGAIVLARLLLQLFKCFISSSAFSLPYDYVLS